MTTNTDLMELYDELYDGLHTARAIAHCAMDSTTSRDSLRAVCAAIFERLSDLRDLMVEQQALFGYSGKIGREQHDE